MKYTLKTTKKMCEGGKNKNSNENTIFFYSFGAGKRNENKESRSFRTIWERSLYAWELFGSNTHTPKRRRVSTGRTSISVAEPPIVDHNSHPAVQAALKTFLVRRGAFINPPECTFMSCSFFFEGRQPERKKTQKVQ